MNSKFPLSVFIKALFFIAAYYISPSFSQSVTFNYTGSVQNWVVPPCVTSINVVAAGADGGGANGGNGAIVSATLAVTPGQTLQIKVGGSGACPGAGYNGGGTGGNAGTAANRACGGGGATDIRISPYGNANRLLVAAGGGGMGGGTEDAIGGVGGCASGTAGTSPFGQGGGGATQSAGGSAGPPWISSGNSGTAGTLGTGGNGGTDPCYNVAPGGGGGGGYYGGGGGGSDCFSLSPYGGGSGGGGSSLIPAGGGCTSGTNNGPGYLTITYTIGTGTATATNTGPYCAGALVQLNGSGGNATSTYTWTGPNGFSSSLQNPTIVSSTAANAGTYNLTVSSSGCTATASTTVVINPLPIVNAGIDQTICIGNTVTLNGSGATSYSWNNGVTNGNPFSPLTTTTYTLTGTTSGCTNSDQVLVTVNPLPTVVANDVSVCPNGTIPLNASGASTYNWSPATGLNSTTGSTVNSTPSSTITYTVSGTDLNGCINSDPVTVTVLASAPVNAGPDVIICQNGSTILSASGAVNYTWDNGLGNGNNVSITPLSTTTYNVVGTDANGCLGYDDLTITVNPNPTINAGIDQAVCNGASVTLSGSGAMSYTWNNGVNDGVSFVPLSSNNYTVTGTNANGCTGTDQVTITVNPLPIVNAGVDQSVCAGNSVTLTGSGTNTYSWNNGITNGIAFTPSSTLTYTVIGTDLNGCTNSDDVIVTYNSLPLTNAGADVTICNGQSVTLNASGASTYTWNNSITNGTSFIPSLGTTTYTVTGTSSAGCIALDQVDVIVNPNPSPTIQGTLTYCVGYPTSLNADAVYSAYTWSTGSISNTSSATISNNPITLTVTNNFGCQGISPAVSVTELANITTNTTITICQGQTAVIHGVNQSVAGNYSQNFTSPSGCDSISNVQLIVTALPIINAGADQTICAGNQAVLTASGGAGYIWNNGVTNAVLFTPNLGSTVYTVTGTGPTGCINTDQVNINVIPLPSVNFEADVLVGCTPLTVNFINNTVGATNCQWNMSDGTSLSGCVNVTNIFEQIDCFDISLTTTDNNGCSNTLTVPNMICVEGPPIASFNPTPSVLNEYDSETQFLNTTIGGSTYHWDFGDNSGTTTVENPFHDYAEAGIGNYIVTLIAYSPTGCSDTTTRTIQLAEDLIYYVPNSFTPDDDTYNQSFQPVFTSGYDPFDYSLFIYNRWGEIIFESHDAQVGWDGTYGIDGSLVKEGTYTWKIEFKTKASDERKMEVGHVNVLR
jgi:gliding motility-associated-like protein